jgi:phosphatidylserine/phosphatidylglycerophosphate/cardiolipin synthase-like enzyme
MTNRKSAWTAVAFIAVAMGAAAGSQPEGAAAAPDGVPATTQAGAPKVTVYFSPETDLGALVVERIGKATTSMHVQAYSLSSAAIADALIAAHNRGVEVRVVIDADRAGEDDSEAKRLANAGVATFGDAKESKAHSKIMLIDGHTVVTGSFNFAEASEKGKGTADNLLLIEDAGEVMAAYEANFAKHLEHSKRIKAK